MSIFDKVQEKTIAKVMQQTVRKHLKSYRKKGIHPTAEQVMQDIDSNTLAKLTSYGYPPDRIKVVVDNELRRCK